MTWGSETWRRLLRKGSDDVVVLPIISANERKFTVLKIIYNGVYRTFCGYETFSTCVARLCWRCRSIWLTLQSGTVTWISWVDRMVVSQTLLVIGCIVLVARFTRCQQEGKRVHDSTGWFVCRVNLSFHGRLHYSVLQYKGCSNI